MHNQHQPTIARCLMQYEPYGIDFLDVINRDWDTHNEEEQRLSGPNKTLLLFYTVRPNWDGLNHDLAKPSPLRKVAKMK